MSDATKVLQTGVDTGDGSTYPQPVVVVDAAGNPIDLTKANGAAITSVTAVALAAGAAPTATLADGVLTLGIPAGAKGGNGDPGASRQEWCSRCRRRGREVDFPDQELRQCHHRRHLGRHRRQVARLHRGLT